MPSACTVVNTETTARSYLYCPKSANCTLFQTFSNNSKQFLQARNQNFISGRCFLQYISLFLFSLPFSFTFCFRFSFSFATKRPFKSRGPRSAVSTPSPPPPRPSRVRGERRPQMHFLVYLESKASGGCKIV